MTSRLIKGLGDLGFEVEVLLVNCRNSPFFNVPRNNQQLARKNSRRAEKTLTFSSIPSPHSPAPNPFPSLLKVPSVFIASFISKNLLEVSAREAIQLA